MSSVADPHSFHPDPIGSGSNPDPGLLWPKIVKKITAEKSLQLSKKAILHFKAWNFLIFFLLLWVSFAFLDPDRIPNPDPDPLTRLNPDPIGIRIRNPDYEQRVNFKVWWQDATRFVYFFIFFITYIHSFNHIYTIHLSIPIRWGLSPFLHRLWINFAN
jgi:hypothetical protein